MVFNGSDKAQSVDIKKGDWLIVAQDGKISPTGALGRSQGGKTTLPPYSALILARE